MNEQFKPGDRVQVRPEAADGFKQPWRNRIKRGLYGTVQDSGMHHPIVVRFDMPNRAKFSGDWFWTNVRSDELTLIEGQDHD